MNIFQAVSKLKPTRIWDGVLARTVNGGISTQQASTPSPIPTIAQVLPSARRERLSLSA